jgi:acyl-CoA synthetase (NDP forming)
VRRALAEGALRSGCPAFLASTLPDLVSETGRSELAEAGIPVVSGMRAAVAAAAASQRLGPLDGGTIAEQLRATAATTRKISGKGIEGEGSWLAEHRAKDVLRGAGVAVPPSLTALSPAACLDAAASLDFPLALKLSGPTIHHKSELGAIRIEIADEAELLRQAEDLMSIAGQIHLEAGLAGEPSGEPPVFLVEEMAGRGVELIVTARSDAVVPSLTIGLGGIWAEQLADSVVVPLPASPGQVKEVLPQLKAFGLLDGSRGGRPVDLDRLAEFASRVGDLLLDYRDQDDRGFDLLELNPVVAGPEGAIALDALAHLA